MLGEGGSFKEGQGTYFFDHPIPHCIGWLKKKRMTTIKSETYNTISKWTRNACFWSFSPRLTSGGVSCMVVGLSTFTHSGTSSVMGRTRPYTCMENIDNMHAFSDKRSNIQLVKFEYNLPDFLRCTLWLKVHSIIGVTGLAVQFLFEI